MTAPLKSAADVAELLGISEDLVKRRSVAEHWPCIKFSAKTIRYSEAHVEQIVASHEFVHEQTPEADEFEQTSRSKAKAS